MTQRLAWKQTTAVYVRLNIIHGPTAQDAKGNARSHSRHGSERAKSDRGAARATFHAVEVQGLPVREEFYSASCMGGGWEMPSMQKH